MKGSGEESCVFEDPPFGLLIDLFSIHVLVPFLRSPIRGFSHPVGWGGVLLIVALTSPLAAPCPGLGVPGPSPLPHITMAASPAILGPFCRWGGLSLDPDVSCLASCSGPISALSVSPVVPSARGRFPVVFDLNI